MSQAFEELFFYVEEFNVVICRVCHCALVKKRALRHFSLPSHRNLKVIPNAELVKSLTNKWPLWVESFEELATPEGGSPEIRHLDVFRDGFGCEADDCQFVSRSKSTIRQHCYKTHGLRRQNRTGRPEKSAEPTSRLWSENVWCQAWTTSGTFAKFWRVEQVEEVAQEEPESHFHVLFEQAEGEIEEKRRRGQNMAINASKEKNLWVERTGWEGILQGLNSSELLTIIREPLVGSIAHKIWVLVEELVLGAMGVVSQMKGDYTLQVILQTEQNTLSIKPLLPYQSKETLGKNTRFWQQILMVCFETFDFYQERRTPKIFWSSRQRKCWNDLMDEVRPYPLEQLSAERKEAILSYNFVPVHRALLKFCMSLVLCPGQPIATNLALPRLVAVLGVQKDSSWVPAQHFTSTLSGLLKVIRFFVIAYVYCGLEERSLQPDQGPTREDIDGDESDDEYEGEEISFEAAGLRWPPKYCDTVQMLVQRHLIRGSRSAFEYFMDLRSYGLKIGQTSTASGMIEWDDESLMINKVRIDLPGLQLLVHRVEARARIVLFERILGVAGRSEVPAIPWHSVSDSNQQLKPGYCFADELAAKNWLKDHFGSQFNKLQALGTSHGRQVWLQECREFLRLMLLTTHVTGGQPARATELLTLSFANSPSGLVRNILLRSSGVEFTTRYHKGFTSSRVDKTILRYLPKEVSELLVWFIWLAIPFKRVIERMEKCQSSDHLLWDDDYWKDVDLSQVLQSESLKYLGVGFGTRLYRHIAIAFNRRYLRPREQFKPVQDEEAEDNSNDLQAAHSTLTAEKVYAREIGQVEGLLHSDHFREISRKWHMLLQFESVSSRALVLDTLRQGQKSRLFRWAIQDKREVLARFLEATAEFRSDQYEIIQAIATQGKAVLAVMPTGSGKSLGFMLQAFAQPAGVILVVVPLVALREDLIERCQSKGIRAAAWDGEAISATVVVVVPEHLETQRFEEYLSGLLANCQLDLIVLDECHTLVYDAGSFRPALFRASKLIGLRTRVLLLTATLPPCKVSGLIEQLGLHESDVTVMRGASSRPLISYQVKRWSKRKTQEWLVQEARSKKIVVFFYAKRDIPSFQDSLGSPALVFTSNEDLETKRQAFKQFREGSIRILLASSAFGMGIDLADIEITVHLEPPRSLIDFAQEAGRGGRTKPSIAIVLFGASNVPSVQRFVQGQECRRRVIEEFLDGESERRSCGSEEQVCDWCQQAGKRIALEGPEGEPECQSTEIAISPDRRHRSELGRRLESSELRIRSVQNIQMAVAGLDFQSAVLQPVLQPVLRPVLQPVLQPVLRPVLQPVLQPVLRPVLQPNLRQPVTRQPVESVRQEEQMASFEQRIEEEVNRQALRVQQSKANSAKLDERVKEMMQSLRGSCPVCADATEPHRIGSCSESEWTKALGGFWRSRLQWKKFSCCFLCYMPQRLCGQWRVKAGSRDVERVEMGRCPDHSVVLYAFIFLMNKHKQVWSARLEEVGQSLAKMEELEKWLVQEIVPASGLGVNQFIMEVDWLWRVDRQ